MAMCMAAAALGFTACDLSASGSSGGSSSSSGSKVETSDVDIENYDYGFMKAEDYDPNATTIADTQKYTSLDAGTDYYFILQFDIASRVDNKGTSLLTVEIELDDIDVMTGTIAESNGVSIPMEFVDAATGKNVLSYTTDFKIPDMADTPKTVYIIMELIPVTTGQSHIYLKLSADDFEIYGNDGFTKDLTINAVQLEAPVAIWTENTGTLSWNQIKYAEYYLLYVDDEVLTDSSGNIVRIDVDSNIAVGGEVLYTRLYYYISGYHSVRVQACSTKAIFTASSYSNVVYVTI